MSASHCSVIRFAVPRISRVARSERERHHVHEPERRRLVAVGPLAEAVVTQLPVEVHA